MKIQEHTKILRLVQASLFCALTFVGTVLSIPAGMGNLNFGDGILLFGVFFLDLPWGFAGVLGAVLCDLLGAYAVYAPGTLCIKFLMALVCFFVWKGKKTSRTRRIFAGILSELLMMGGYYLYESLFLLGFDGAVVNLPFNGLQGGFAVILFLVLTETARRQKWI